MAGKNRNTSVDVGQVKECARVLLLNRSYWPDAEATGQLLTELCEDLAEGLDVSVICGQPNHNPDNAPFRRWGKQVRNQVTIRRVPHTMFHKRWRRRWRALNMLTFMFWATVAALLTRRPDVVVVETDPPLLCLLGRFLQRWRGCRLVVYVQDIYPDVAQAIGQLPHWFPYQMVRRIFYQIYRHADLVVVLSQDMQRFLVESGVPPERIAVVPNWVDTRAVYPVKFANSFRREQGLNDRFVVMYSGNMGLSQNLMQLLDAADLLRDRGDIVFALIGDGASREDLEQRAAELNLRNVRFFDYQPKDLLSQSLSAADVHVVLLEPALSALLMPSKIYGVLASGTPAIVLADPNSELARLIEGEDVGLVVRPGDAQRLASQICFCAENTSLMRKLGIRARALAIERFDRILCTGQLYQLLTGRPHPGAGDAVPRTAYDETLPQRTPPG